ncbi:MAG TPA: protein kinase [Kofleriaceae bacterium]|jgi:serine/threonine-protein kinase|nr:protein kinase [Kofleriaceae bacterium]
MDDSLVGRMLADRYDVLALLGIGGMGAVYRARDRELDEVVALKVIRSEIARDPSALERFRSEVKLARRVTHGNVARTFELGSADGVLFCTMELVDGESLTERLRRAHKLPVAEAVSIACALLDGLAAAHEANVIHRDIKPDNVLLARDGRVVIADFGVAAMLASGGEASGTPAYMSPEQACGEPATPASDVYSVGIVLYEALTGRHAFTGHALQILAEKLELDRVSPGPDEVPAELGRVIARATERELTARYATARELRRALEPWATKRFATIVPVESHDDDGITVMLIQPHGDDARLHLAQAVHEAVATLLGKQPGLRVLTRAKAPGERGAVVVDFSAGAQLAVSVRGSVALGLVLPLAADQIATSARAATAAILAAGRPAVVTTPIDELVMRARYLLTRDYEHLPEVVKLLEDARVLAPDDARVAAALANAHVRAAFFAPAADPNELARAAELARSALAIAPELAESHVAMGHVELHGGDAVASASHYRRAIARSPYVGEAHEYLGRLLLEAGYVELGLARLEESIASALALTSSIRTRWDIARAYALEQRWNEHDALIAELGATQGAGRSLLLARFGWWRGDSAPIAALRAEPDHRLFERHVVDAMIATFLDGAWASRRDTLVKFGLSTATNVRRRNIATQLAAEAAGFANDAATCNMLVDYAVGEGLFDLHWIDKCTLLECVRGTAAFTASRACVRGRAEAILDAFYGDHAVVEDTAIAPSSFAERRR